MNASVTDPGSLTILEQRIGAYSVLGESLSKAESFGQACHTLEDNRDVSTDSRRMEQ